MLLHELFEDVGGYKPYNPRQIDPALLTFDEYEKVANPQQKYHDDRAYDASLERLNSYGTEGFDKVLQTFRVNGLRFQMRLRVERYRYAKRDAEGNILKVDGEVQYWTDAEAEAAGKAMHAFSIAIFNEDNQIVGRTQDEWGCLLVRVAREYRGFGFGPRLVKVARTLEPARNSGGFTPGGHNNFRKVHREFVRDALTNGLYRKLIAQGSMSPARVKEIIASADLKQRPKTDTLDLSTSDPKNWLLYGEHGAFYLYDRKLETMLKDELDYSHSDFVEKAMKGLVLARDNGGNGILVQFGARNDKLKTFMLYVAASWCAEEGIAFYIDEDDLKFAPADLFSLEPVSNKTGMKRAKATLKKEPLPLNAMTRAERQFRKSFDRHDEFKYRLDDLAYGEYGNGGH